MRFEFTWKNKCLTDGAKTLADMIDRLTGAADLLREMQDAGVVLDDEVTDDFAFLVTDDPAVAQRFDFCEPEAYDEDDEDDLGEDEEGGADDDGPPPRRSPGAARPRGADPHPPLLPPG